MMGVTRAPTAEDTIPGYSKILDDLTKMMEAMPPAPILASSQIFPPDAAWQFTDGRQEYLCAGPAFWAKIPVTTLAPPAVTIPSLLGGIQIIDIDLPTQDAMRSQVFDALIAALRSGAKESIFD
jgi:hypothetical protein